MEFPENIQNENAWVGVGISITSLDVEGMEVDISKGSASLVLPAWITQRPNMICPAKSIIRKQLIGSGQYGEVHKGVFLHGNGV